MAGIFGSPKQPEIGQDIGKFVAGAGSYGMAIPYVFGCALVPEFRLWQQPVANVHEVDNGGKGGGGKGGNQYTYSGSYFSGFCLGAIPKFGNKVAIRKIFGDSVILADFSERKLINGVYETDKQMNERMDNSRKFMNSVTVYEGLTSGQAVDSHVKAALGGINIPAYQGIVCMHFNDINFPNGRPYTIKAEVCQSASLTGIDQIIRESCALSTILTRLLVDSGIKERNIDTSLLTNQQVRGVIIAQDQRRQAIDNFMRYFDLECVQSGEVITFVPIDRPTLVNIPFIPFSDLTANVVDDSGNTLDPLEIEDIKESDLPHQIIISAKNYDNDYVNISETATNAGSIGDATMQYDLGELVATTTELKQVAQKQLLRIQTERCKYSFSLPSWYSNLEPCDVVNVQDDDGSVTTLRIKQVDLGGTDKLVKVQAVRHVIHTSQIQGQVVAGGLNIMDAGETTYMFMNLPPLHDAEADFPVFYIAATGINLGWVKADVYQSKDGGNNYSKKVSIPSYARIGTCDTILGNGSTYTFDDTNTLDVTVPRGTFENITDEQMFLYGNLCLVGQELIQFGIATLIGSTTAGNQYRLSHLLRGRKGTESFTSSHVSGEKIVLLNDINGNLDVGVVAVQCQYSDVGRVDYWKIVPNFHNLEQETATTFAANAQNMLPYDPVNLQTSIDNTSGSPDVTFLWYRRDRKGSSIMNGQPLPLSDVPEKYHIKFVDTSNHVYRDLYVNTNTFIYTHDMRNTDYGSPTAIMSGTIQIAQVSPNVGDGKFAILTLNSTNT